MNNQLFSCEQTRELDRRAIEEHGIAGIRLMKRAGRAIFEQVLKYWPDARNVTILCGGGNNGGDGYVVAGLAAQSGINAQVYYLKDPESLKGDALRAYQFAVQENVAIEPWSADQNIVADVLVDAMLGTGFRGEPSDQFAEAINAVNRGDSPVISVDVPSGLNADTGHAPGVAIVADITVNFIGNKRGLFTGQGKSLAGYVVFDNLQVPNDIYHGMNTVQQLRLQSEILKLPLRDANAHKGDFGHLMIVGGDLGMGGAVAMAAEAALRTGAGLVSVVTRPEQVAAVLARRPEIMVHGVVSGQELEPLLDRPTTFIVGPGLGQSPWSEQMLQQVMATGKPMVIDADALNLLASKQLTVNNPDAIITPHPGEAARLLGMSTADVQSDRFKAVSQLADKYSAVSVLKGAGSLVATGAGDISLCDAGNPGMASGGMGDVLSGVIGGLLAQGLEAGDAAMLGVTIHAVAGDIAASRRGEVGLLATDLFGPVQELLNEVV